ncbi:hypothetical protein B0H19DRAFT_1070869 [Mycena capillaripes]|nr:hypothetical protein B0H19DRAFT_1070869 [Mycena capillaripes]
MAATTVAVLRHVADESQRARAAASGAKAAGLKAPKTDIWVREGAGDALALMRVIGNLLLLLHRRLALSLPIRCNIPPLHPQRAPKAARLIDPLPAAPSTRFAHSRIRTQSSGTPRQCNADEIPQAHQDRDGPALERLDNDPECVECDDEPECECVRRLGAARPAAPVLRGQSACVMAQRRPAESDTNGGSRQPSGSRSAFCLPSTRAPRSGSKIPHQRPEERRGRNALNAVGYVSARTKEQEETNDFSAEVDDPDFYPSLPRPAPAKVVLQADTSTEGVRSQEICVSMLSTQRRRVVFKGSQRAAESSKVQEDQPDDTLCSLCRYYLFGLQARGSACFGSQYLEEAQPLLQLMPVARPEGEGTECMEVHGELAPAENGRPCAARGNEKTLDRCQNKRPSTSNIEELSAEPTQSCRKSISIKHFRGGIGSYGPAAKSGVSVSCSAAGRSGAECNSAGGACILLLEVAPEIRSVSSWSGISRLSLSTGYSDENGGLSLGLRKKTKQVLRVLERENKYSPGQEATTKQREALWAFSRRYLVQSPGQYRYLQEEEKQKNHHVDVSKETKRESRTRSTWGTIRAAKESVKEAWQKYMADASGDCGGSRGKRVTSKHEGG